MGTISKTPVAQRLMSLVRVGCQSFLSIHVFFRWQRADDKQQADDRRQTAGGSRQTADGRLSVRSVCCFHFVSRYPTSPSVGDVASDFISLLETPPAHQWAQKYVFSFCLAMPHQPINLEGNILTRRMWIAGDEAEFCSPDSFIFAFYQNVAS